MSHGPITIFDKSAFEALNIDDAALFGVFYRIALTTLFFVETLADLEKEVLRGRTDATADTREPYLMSTGQPSLQTRGNKVRRRCLVGARCTLPQVGARPLPPVQPSHF